MDPLQLPPGVLSQLLEQQQAQLQAYPDSLSDVFNNAFSGYGQDPSNNPSPMSQAMAQPPVDPQDPNTGPPPDPTNLLPPGFDGGGGNGGSSSPNGSAPAPRGILGGLWNNPSGNRALLAFGANLLSDPDFFSGFGKAALAYQQERDAEAAALKPKVGLTNDNTFQYSVDPKTGQYTFTRTPVADYNLGILGQKEDAAQALQKLKGDQASDRQTQSLTHQDQWHSQADDTKRYGIDANTNNNKRNNQTKEDVANIMARSRAATAAVSKGQKLPPGQVIKLIGDDQQNAMNNQNTLALGQRVLDSIQNGTLQMDAYHNLINKGKLATNIGSDAGSVAYGDLQQFLEKLSYNILLDAKGVQTEGDAKRSKIMSLVAQGNAPAAVQELRTTLQQLQDSHDFHMAKASDLSRQYGADNTETNAFLSGQQSRTRGSSRPSSGSTSSGVKWRIVN